VWDAASRKACDTSDVSANDVRAVLRALAEARDGAFYRLWVQLTKVWPTPSPSIGFKIAKIAQGDDALAIVSVGGTRPDGLEALWSLTVAARAETLAITGEVELSHGDSWVTSFEEHFVHHDPAVVAESIAVLAIVVCDQRQLLDQLDD